MGTSWPGLSRPSTRFRASIRSTFPNLEEKPIIGSPLQMKAYSETQFLPNDRVDGRDKPGHDGERGVREFAPVTDVEGLQLSTRPAPALRLHHASPIGCWARCWWPVETVFYPQARPPSNPISPTRSNGSGWRQGLSPKIAFMPGFPDRDQKLVWRKLRLLSIVCSHKIRKSLKTGRIQRNRQAPASRGLRQQRPTGFRPVLPGAPAPGSTICRALALDFFARKAHFGAAVRRPAPPGPMRFSGANRAFSGACGGFSRRASAAPEAFSAARPAAGKPSFGGGAIGATSWNAAGRLWLPRGRKPHAPGKPKERQGKQKERQGKPNPFTILAFSMAYTGRG